MSCPETRTTMRYLRGELSEREAGKSLGHLRHCPPCRDAFRFGASALSAVDHESSPDHDRETPPSPTPLRPGLGSMFFPSSTVRRAGGSRIIIVAAAAAVLYMLLQPRSPAGDAERFAAEAAAAAIGSGTPLIRSPAGEQPGRPRVVSALLPPAAASCRIIVLDAGGRIIHEREHVPGEGGCTAAGIELPSGSGRLQALSVAIPFPGSEALSLDPGRSYGVSVAVPGGHLAASSTFRICPGP